MAVDLRQLAAYLIVSQELQSHEVLRSYRAKTIGPKLVIFYDTQWVIIANMLHTALD